MYGILNVSRTGMSATQNKINVISNNVVNANTTGYILEVSESRVSQLHSRAIVNLRNTIKKLNYKIS